MVTRRPRRNPGKSLWSIGEDAGDVPRPTRNKSKPATVEGTPFSPVRLYWPDGRMRPMPGDAVYTTVPGLYGVSVAKGVAVKHGDSVRVKSQGKSHPASTRWIVDGDPKVKAEESLKRIEKEHAASNKRKIIEESREAVASEAKRRRLRPITSPREIAAGDTLYRITSDGAYGDGNPHKIRIQSAVVLLVDGDEFRYENEHGGESTGGKITNWWRA